MSLRGKYYKPNLFFLEFHKIETGAILNEHRCRDCNKFFVRRGNSKKFCSKYCSTNFRERWLCRIDQEIALKINERRKKYWRRYAKAHPGRTNSWKKAHPEVNKIWQLKSNKQRKIKLKQEQEEEAGRAHAHTCELCYKSTKTVFDHDHGTGKFRGWICNRCNLTLGYVKDDINLLKRMVDYLESGLKILDGTHL